VLFDHQTHLISFYSKPQIFWKKNDEIIHDGTTLMLNNLRVRDSSPYICNAVNEVGSSEKVFYVTVVEPPQITSNFNDVSLLTNQTKQIECKASGTPDPEVFWTFEGLKVRSGSKLVLESSMHSGKYSCVAENSEGRAEESFEFIPINKPSLLHNFEVIKKDVKLRDGDDFELFCPFENFNKILWSFNNSTIENFPHRMNENKLNLMKVDTSFNGEWRCAVSNTAGTETFSFKITVLASPIIHPSWNLNNRVSEFLFTESDIDERTFKVGENLLLNCTAQGFPKPKVTWKKATDVISEGEVLTIRNLQFHHSDIYTCGAENEQGTVKKFFKVDVVAAPSIETDLEIQRNFQQAIGDSVTLRCRIGGNPTPTIFWFKNK
jgi:hemicentin